MERNRRQFLVEASCEAVTAAAALRPASATAEPGTTIETRFAAPAGYDRPPVDDASFAAWLRRLPLKAAGTPVFLHTGEPKPRQDLHAAIIDIDVGTRDLQQCADAVMRLRAEWQFATNQTNDITFNDTGGGAPMRWSRWAAGERPAQQGNRLVWSKRSDADQSRASFRRYLDTVFTWAGTHSLERELVAASAVDIQAGDVIIRGGFPGHAVIVVDAVYASTANDRLVLLAQSYMPAQSIHVLKNLTEPSLSPWYRIRDSHPVATPEWTFAAGSLKRWR